MKNSNLYIKIVFPRRLILNMLRIRDYKKTLAIYLYIWNSMYQNALHSGTQTKICIVRQDQDRIIYNTAVQKYLIPLRY